MREQTTIRPGPTERAQVRPLGTGVLVRAVLAAVAAETAGAILAGSLRLVRLAGRATVRAARLVRAYWYRLCGAVLVAAAVAGLVAMLAAPLLLAVTSAR